MYSAQAQLADAYIAAGAATEARFIAEDLVAREPWEQVEPRAFPPRAGAARRARSGRADRGAVERRVAVHEHRPVQRPRISRRREPPPPVLRGGAGRMPLATPAGVGGRGRGADRAKSEPAKPVRRKHEEHHFELSANAIDLESILGELRQAVRRRRARVVRERRSRSEHRARRHQTAAGPAPSRRPPPAPAPAERSRRRLRHHARRSRGARALDDAEKEYKRGLALREAGRHRRLHRRRCRRRRGRRGCGSRRRG